MDVCLDECISISMIPHDVTPTHGYIPLLESFTHPQEDARARTLQRDACIQEQQSTSTK